MKIGNKPIDGGNFLFTTDERDAFLAIEPGAKPYFHRFLGAEEFINRSERWCLWLGDATPKALRSMPHVLKRSEEHTSELQSLMRISYAVFCLKKKTQYELL